MTWMRSTVSLARLGPMRRVGWSGRQIGWFRRNHRVPVPEVASVDEPNALIDGWDADDEARRIGGRARTVGEFFAVGGAGARGLVPGLRQRPAQDRRPLVGQVPGGALVIGGVDGDVQTAVPHCLRGGGEPAGIAQERLDHRGHQQAHGEQFTSQRLARGLPAGEPGDLRAQRRELGFEAFHPPQRYRDGLRPAADRPIC